MRLFVVTLVAAMLASPAVLRAEASVQPAPKQVVNITPVDDLLVHMTSLLNIIGDVDDIEDLSAEKQAQVASIVAKIDALKAKSGSYKITPADRESIVRWSRTTNERIFGEKMTADDIAELRQELAGYNTLDDIISELDVDEF